METYLFNDPELHMDVPPGMALVGGDHLDTMTSTPSASKELPSISQEQGEAHLSGGTGGGSGMTWGTATGSGHKPPLDAASVLQSAAALALASSAHQAQNLSNPNMTAESFLMVCPCLLSWYS